MSLYNSKASLANCQVKFKWNEAKELMKKAQNLSKIFCKYKLKA